MTTSSRQETYARSCAAIAAQDRANPRTLQIDWVCLMCCRTGSPGQRQCLICGGCLMPDRGMGISL